MSLLATDAATCNVTLTSRLALGCVPRGARVPKLLHESVGSICGIANCGGGWEEVQRGVQNGIQGPEGGSEEDGYRGRGFRRRGLSEVVQTRFLGVFDGGWNMF